MLSQVPVFVLRMYPSRINSGAGLKLVRRHGFLFQRFTRECYFYGTLLLLRNIIVSLVPVAFAAVPEVQMVIMGAVLVTLGDSVHAGGLFLQRVD